MEKVFVRLADPSGSCYDPTTSCFVGGDRIIEVPLSANANKAITVGRLVKLSDEAVGEHKATLTDVADAPAPTAKTRKEELEAFNNKALVAAIMVFDPAFKQVTEKKAELVEKLLIFELAAAGEEEEYKQQAKARYLTALAAYEASPEGEDKDYQRVKLREMSIILTESGIVLSK